MCISKKKNKKTIAKKLQFTVAWSGFSHDLIKQNGILNGNTFSHLSHMTWQSAIGKTQPFWKNERSIRAIVVIAWHHSAHSENTDHSQLCLVNILKISQLFRTKLQQKHGECPLFGLYVNLCYSKWATFKKLDTTGF